MPKQTEGGTTDPLPSYVFVEQRNYSHKDGWPWPTSSVRIVRDSGHCGFFYLDEAGLNGRVKRWFGLVLHVFRNPGPVQ
jgi:hypothetical protein